MASGDPFIVYYPSGTVVPFGYTPAVGVTLVITYTAGEANTIKATQNAGANYANNMCRSYFTGAGTNFTQGGDRPMINNTTGLWFQEINVTNYGTAICGMEL
jgi:hypothetical protein